MCIKIRQGACSNPAAEGFHPEFLISLVLGWGPNPAFQQVLRCCCCCCPPGDHTVRTTGLEAGVQLQKEVSYGAIAGVSSQTQESYHSPLSTPSPMTVTPGCLSQQGLQIQRRKVSRELFYTDLITRQLNHGSLARNPLKVLCAGFNDGHTGKLHSNNCSVTGRGRDKL